MGGPSTRPPEFAVPVGRARQ